MIRFGLFAALITVAILAGEAQAKDHGWYVGGSIGQAEAVSYCPAYSSAVTNPSSSGCDQTATMRRIVLGFQSNQYFGVEFGYVDLGKTSERGTGTASGCGSPCTSTTTWPFTYTDETRRSGVQFAGVGSIPLGEGLSLIGKLGWLRWKFRDSFTVDQSIPASVVTTYFTNPVSRQTTVSGNTLMVGVGIKYEINEKFALRGEFEMTARHVGDSKAGESTIQIYGVSLMYGF